MTLETISNSIYETYPWRIIHAFLKAYLETHTAHSIEFKKCENSYVICFTIDGIYTVYISNMLKREIRVHIFMLNLSSNTDLLIGTKKFIINSCISDMFVEPANTINIARYIDSHLS